MEAKEAMNASHNEPNCYKNQNFFRFMARIKFRITLAVSYGYRMIR